MKRLLLLVLCLLGRGAQGPRGPGAQRSRDPEAQRPCPTNQPCIKEADCPAFTDLRAKMRALPKGSPERARLLEQLLREAVAQLLELQPLAAAVTPAAGAAAVVVGGDGALGRVGLERRQHLLHPLHLVGAVGPRALAVARAEEGVDEDLGAVRVGGLVSNRRAVHCEDYLDGAVDGRGSSGRMAPMAKK